MNAWNSAHLNDQRDLSSMDKENQLHVLAMIPQIFLITCAEILCSITVLEFAYAYVSYFVEQFLLLMNFEACLNQLQVAVCLQFKI